MPAQLLQNRPDIREAERELAAAGLDVRVARANFYPKLFITGAVGYDAFNTKYLFLTPESLIYSVAGDLVGPLINKAAIKADYMNANARQLQAVYEYQRTVLNAFTEVINYVSKVQNYSTSIEIKRQQLQVARGLGRCRQQTFSECPRPIHGRAVRPARPGGRENGLDRNQTAATDCRRRHLSSPRRRLSAEHPWPSAAGDGRFGNGARRPRNAADASAQPTG